MASSNLTYGEVIYETSRAFPDDEDEEIDTNYSANLEKTEAGELFLQQGKSGEKGVLCIFNGKVAVGFGEGFLALNNHKTLGTVTFVGSEGTVDSLLERPRKKVAVKIVKLETTTESAEVLLFAFVDSYGIPRSYANEIMEAMQPFIQPVKQVVIFHNEPLVTFIGMQAEALGKMFFIRNNAFQSKWIVTLENIVSLKQPNLISGITAAVLTQCEMIDKPALLFVNYCESDLVDSISVQPFLQLIKQDSNKAKATTDLVDGDGDSTEFNLIHHFAKYLPQFNIRSASKTNLRHVTESNLYI